MNRFIPTILASFAFAGAVGCDSPSRGDATLSAASDDQRLRAAHAAHGDDLDLAFQTASKVVRLTGGCPAIKRDGNKVIVEGRGCTDAAMTTFGGVATFKNVVTFDAEGKLGPSDPKKSIDLDFDDFSITNRSGALFFEGDASQSEPFEGDGSYTDFAGLEVAVDGISVRTDATIDCDKDGRCLVAADEPAQLTIKDIGIAYFDAEWSVGDETSGFAEIRGKQTLRADFSAIGTDRCVPYKLDGRSGKLCNKK